MSRSSLRTFWRTRALHLRFWGVVRGRRGWGRGNGAVYLLLGRGLPQETSDGLHGGRSMLCALRVGYAYASEWMVFAVYAQMNADAAGVGEGAAESASRSLRWTD